MNTVRAGEREREKRERERERERESKHKTLFKIILNLYIICV